ncbi:MAG TPA: hypothetical protein VF338_09420 [Leptolinea sp.]
MNVSQVTEKPGNVIKPSGSQETGSGTPAGKNSGNQKAKSGEIRQWAFSAQASSQYGDPNWAASQAVGAPNVFECGDNTNAWASKSDKSVEWIELTFKTAVIPNTILIYQNYHPSQIVEVQMIGPDGRKSIAWDGSPEVVKNCPDLMEISVDSNNPISVNKIKITIDQRTMGWGWDEIDAVELVGTLP